MNQEQFWQGEFGTDYCKRNHDKFILAANLRLWSKIVERTNGIKWVLELGSNVGLNLQALSLLKPDTRFTAVEINKKACQILSDAKFMRDHLANSVRNLPIIDFINTEDSSEEYDLVFTSGVLIHQNPDDLPKIYDFMGKASQRYVVINEYYNPTPVTIEYRGHSDKLFKRDFAGEFLQANPNYRLVDYGFVSHSDPNFPKDDTTWFLMEKR